MRIFLIVFLKIFDSKIITSKVYVSCKNAILIDWDANSVKHLKVFSVPKPHPDGLIRKVEYSFCYFLFHIWKLTLKFQKLTIDP